MKESWEEATKPREYYRLFLCSSWSRSRKGSSAWIASNRWGRRRPFFWTRQSCFLSSNFSSASIDLFIDKLMLVTECTAIKPWVETIIYPSNISRIAHAQQRSHSIHAESFLSTLNSSKRKKGVANRVGQLMLRTRHQWSDSFCFTTFTGEEIPLWSHHWEVWHCKSFAWVTRGVSKSHGTKQVSEIHSVHPSVSVLLCDAIKSENLFNTVH